MKSTVTVTTVAASQWIPVDYTKTPFALGIQVKSATTTTTATWSVEMTADDIFDSAITPTAITAPSPLEAGSQAANELATMSVPCRAVRLNVSALDTVNNSVTMTVIQGRS